MARISLYRNKKFGRLVHRLGLPRPYVWGLLEMMWSVAHEAVDPVLGDAIGVEAAAEWPGKPGELFEALKLEGFIDLVEGGEYEIHDYWENCPAYVKQRALRKKREAEEASLYNGHRKSQKDEKRSPHGDQNAENSDGRSPHGDQNAENSDGRSPFVETSVDGCESDKELSIDAERLPNGHRKSQKDEKRSPQRSIETRAPAPAPPRPAPEISLSAERGGNQHLPGNAPAKPVEPVKESPEADYRASRDDEERLLAYQVEVVNKCTGRIGMRDHPKASTFRLIARHVHESLILRGLGSMQDAHQDAMGDGRDEPVRDLVRYYLGAIKSLCEEAHLRSPFGRSTEMPSGNTPIPASAAPT